MSPHFPSEARRNVTVHIGDKKLEVPAGTLVSDLVTVRKDSQGFPYLGAIINNRLVDLETSLHGPAMIQPVSIASREGVSIYRRTATLILYQATRDLFPKIILSIGQSLGYGYHFTIKGPDGEEHISTEQLELLQARMQEIVNEDRKIKRTVIAVEEARNFFTSQNSMDKVSLLNTWRSWDVHITSCGTYYDIQQGPLAPSTGCISGFTLENYPPGLVLVFPVVQEDTVRSVRKRSHQTLFQIYQETKKWNEILGVSNVGQLNELCLNGGVRDIIRVSEGFHEKKIAQIADQIADRREQVRMVLIAGPSASGKTTFSKRLGVQLQVNGIKPLGLSMDNYYVDRDQTPRHPDGTFDFEAIEAVDLTLFNKHLVELLNGKTIYSPVFDFHLGKRLSEDNWIPISLSNDQVIVIEGIHGLNPQFTEAIQARQKFKIFASALTQLGIDNSNRIFTSESRLLRRIVRDRRYRGYKATETIELWPSVRLGERRHIFPFQEEADVMFNTALLYEPAVLKVFAERYLLEVHRNHPSAVAAHSLLKFLDLFVPILPDGIPQTSILREFIGGSGFNY